MAAKPTDRDQLGNVRASGEASEAKEPLPEEEVPGVRGPVVSSGERREPPAFDAQTWGSEGGAGAYPGAPVVTEERPDDAPRAPRRSSS